MTNLNITFYMMVSVYRLPVVEIWNSPKFHVQLQNGSLYVKYICVGYYLSFL